MDEKPVIKIPGLLFPKGFIRREKKQPNEELENYL